MNNYKNNLVSGTIKGIQIVDLEKKINNNSKSNKYYSIKFNKTKNLNNFNNAINNDLSFISPKDSISNKNPTNSSKIRPRPHITISSNHNDNKNAKIKNNIITKNNKRNLLKIKSNTKKSNNFPKPIEQRQKEIVIFKEKKEGKKLLENSKNKKIEINNNINNNIYNSIPKKLNNPIKKLKSEPNMKKLNYSRDNSGGNMNYKNKNLYEKDQKRQLKLVFRRILSMNTEADHISYIKTSIPTINCEIGTTIDINNCYDEKKERKNKDKNSIKYIKKSKTNNKSYIISKDKNENEKNNDNIKYKEKRLNKIIKKNINKDNYNSNNSKNNQSLYLKENTNIHKLNNSNSLGAIKENYKKYNIRNLSNIKNNNDILNASIINNINKMNNTFNNNVYRLNASSKSKNKSKIIENKLVIKNKKYNNSKNNKENNKLNNFINNQIINNKITDNLIKSPSKNRQINIIMIHSNAKNNINKSIIATSSNKNKSKEKNGIKGEGKDNNIPLDLPSKNEIIRKIKNNKNISSQKNRKNNHYNRSNINQNINSNSKKGKENINKYRIVKKIKNNSKIINSSKVINLKENVKSKTHNLLNETNYNDSSNIHINSIIKNSSEIIQKNDERKILSSNNSCEDLQFNKIISIQKIKINGNNNKIYDIINFDKRELNSKNQKRKKIEESFNNKNSGLNINKSYNIGKNVSYNNSNINPINNEAFNKTLNIYEKPKVKKIISISCTMKNQKDKKTKIKVRRRQQSAINHNNNSQINKNLYQKITNNIFNISLKNKNNPQTVNIDLQNDSYIRNKNKFKNSSKKFFSKEEPMPPKKIISQYKQYLKEYEIKECKQIDEKGELIYYLGEIQERINNQENTFSKINQSFTLSNKKNNFNKYKSNNKEKSLEFNKKKIQEERILINRSCNKLRERKDENLKRIKVKFEQNIFNDEEGDYKLIIGSHLNYRYEIIECLGKGSFGEAIKCYDYKNKEFVCIKIINSEEKFQNQALIEIKILSTISSHDINDDSNNVKFYNYFYFRGHICLVFELLGKNLYEYIKLNNYIGLDIIQIKNYALQILFSLLFLRNINIIHCDLKPENILIFPNNINQIKVIDFGSSCFEKERIYCYIQSRFYRAPEVLLDLGYNYEIDIWSLGCILFELYTGSPLFPGTNEMEQIYLIMEKIGVPPLYLIEKSPKARIFFDNNLRPFKLKDENNNIIKPGSRKIKDLLINAPNNFIDFINKCLLWNPQERLTPDKALLHPFIIENMSEPELYKHKLKVKHIKYGMQINTINSTRNKENKKKEIMPFRGNSCEVASHNKKMLLKTCNNEVIYTNTVCSEIDEIKKNHLQKYSITQGNNKYYNVFRRKNVDKKLPLSIDIDINLRRINTTENNENKYRKISKYKKNKNKLHRHLPKKKSLGRGTNYKKIKNI